MLFAGQNRTERSFQDGTLDGGRSALLRKERSAEDGELDAGRNGTRAQDIGLRALDAL